MLTTLRVLRALVSLGTMQAKGGERPLQESLATRFEQVDGVCFVSLEGELSLSTFLRLRQQLYQAVDSGYLHLAIVVDQVAWLDTTGLAVIIGAVRRVRERGGDAVLVCSSQQHSRVMRLTNVDRIVHLVATRTEAVQWLKGRAITVPRSPRRSGRLSDQPAL